MKHIRTLLLMTLALCLLLSAAPAEEAPGYDFGDVVADFTVTTTDGETLTLSGLLQEKKAVMLNFFFAACGPCRMEFPFMEQAWQDYRDDVAVLALSPYDSAEDIAAYKAELGLTFPMAADTAGLTNLFVSSGFPTTVIIDRNGVFCYHEVGSMPSAYSFRKLFEAYSAEDYTQPLLGYVIPEPTPEEPMPASEAIAAALGSKAISYTGEEGSWPWLLKDGVLVSGNSDAGASQAVLHLDFTAKQGDVLLLEYRVSANTGYDFLRLEQDDQVHKQFTADRGWQTYAWTIPADGPQRATLRFDKVHPMPAGENAAMLRSVKLLTGQAAADALAAAPALPAPLTGAAISLEARAQEILIDDPHGLMEQIIGLPARYYIASDLAMLEARIGPDVDPETAFLYESLTQGITMLAQGAVEGDAFTFPGKVYSMEDGDNPFSVFVLYPAMDASLEQVQTVVLFADEANADYLLKTYVSQATGGAISGLEWSYAAPAEATYTIIFVDETGTRLPGVIANICDDDACMPMFSDENGVVTFTMAANTYEIHVISAPEGIAFDPNQGYEISENSGLMTITLPRK